MVEMMVSMKVGVMVGLGGGVVRAATVQLEARLSKHSSELAHQIWIYSGFALSGSDQNANYKPCLQHHTGDTKILPKLEARMWINIYRSTRIWNFS